jgi:transcriptional regulator with XRE-family HTH domain
VVPPSKTSTTAATPIAKSAFEISPARQSPNVPAMISIARGNEVNTAQAHAKSLSPDVSQEALAAKLKVAPNTVSRWETGKYKPTPKDLDGLARFFSVSITTFFPNLQADDPRVTALTSATGGLEDKDFDEVIRYAEFRKARRAMENAKRSKK